MLGLSASGRDAEYDDKRAIAGLVGRSPSTAIHPAREEVMKSFVASLEAKLASWSTGKRFNRD